MSSVPGPSTAARAPLGRRAFVAIVLVGLSAFAWGGVARDTTKDVLPHSLLPWVLLKDRSAPELPPAIRTVDVPGIDAAP